ncbi:MAG: glycoside hydrolase family 2 [Alistipes sp.]|nr:glycoside hydrolase family 2 [Alistipes sp.]
MKNLLQRFVLALFAVTALAACSKNELERNFQTPPDEVQTAVYWYWISGNISKEGVIDDLHAMKRAGINRAFIGDIGQDGLYTDRNVKIFSDEWWDILHTALKTATELDIEIGIFNSPGWSQSGGPWVKPNEAMRYLASTQSIVNGPQKVTLKMDTPHKDFQPVRTIAYPAPKGFSQSLKVENMKLTLPKGVKELSELKRNEKNEIELATAGEPITVRSLTIYPAEKPMLTTAHLQAKVDGEFKTIADFKIDRSNENLNVGFAPYAPVTVALPATTASAFRLVMDATSQAGGIKDIELSPSPRISSYAEKTLAKMCQTPLPYWNHYMWSKEPKLDDSSMAIDPSKVIDISSKVAADGTLTWDVPEGEWVVLRTGMVPTGVTNAPATPEATGLEIDKMSRKHVKTHFDAYIGEILRRIPEKDRATFKVVVQDSYETGGQNFTDDMIKEFEANFGYSMLPYLPAYYGYVVGDEQKSERFLWDLRRFIADYVAYQYVGGLKEVSNAHGLTTWLECYGHWGFPGEFLQYGGQSDEIGGEFWSVGELGDIENRAASSCGHIYGKRRIWAESNTSGGPAYSRSPIDMKQRTDRFFTEGINATLLHLYIEQADLDRYPGINAWFGNEFDAHNTWYSHMDLFTSYIKRCNYMLQQGLNMADVAYLIGEDAPKMTGLQSPALPKGYQFDYINAEVLMLGANVAQGNIVLPHGTSYRVLVLPPVDNMRPELLEKIKRMVHDGAIILGTPPVTSPSLQNYPAADAAVEKMSRELWGECFDKKGENNYGKGRVFNGYSLEEVFEAIDLVADCGIEPKTPLLFNHRSTMGAEIYFLSNQSNRKVESAPIFRVDASLRPELWDAKDGSIRALPEYETTDEGIKVPLQFDELGSCFIVFRKYGISTEETANYPAPSSVKEVDGQWRVAFNGKLSSPADVTLNALIDLSKSDDKELRYFSGTMNYTTTIDVENDAERTVLDLGRVECMAKVYVNDRYAGGVWCEPFKVDISDFVEQGENTLRVEVVNKWVNRIVGDLQLPVEERKISLTANPYGAHSDIPASGLIGPVKIEQY